MVFSPVTRLRQDNSMILLPEDQALIKLFIHRKQIQFDTDMKEMYTKQSPEFGVQIYDIVKMLNNFDARVPNVLPDILPFIINRVKDPSDAVQMAKSVFFFVAD